MGSTTNNGLTISFNEEDSTLTFDWDPETHPEYDWLENLTTEHLTKVLSDCIELIKADEENTNSSEV